MFSMSREGCRWRSVLYCSRKAAPGVGAEEARVQAVGAGRLGAPAEGNTMIEYEVVLWSAAAQLVEKLPIVEQKAEAFLADLLRAVPCPWKNENGVVVGAVVGARRLTLSGGTVAVIATVQSRDGRT